MQGLLEVIRSLAIVDNSSTCKEEQPMVGGCNVCCIGQVVNTQDSVKELHMPMSDTAND